MIMVLKCSAYFVEDIGDNFNYWFTYFILILMPLMVLLMVARLNLSIKYFDQLEIIPVFQSSIILLDIVVGGVMLNEF